ncbi:GAF domain-containing protein [Sagittula sp. SSi028]|uniref:GAF domain-containing protein n=1 Tax=Sagittula sp. SSi028 TaxID=3400636 RepID=UPI003AF70861
MTNIRLDSSVHLQADTSDHMIKLTDPGRLDALRNSGLLDGGEDSAHARSVRLASRILRAPVSLVSYVDDKRQHFRGQIGMCGPAAEDCGTPLTHSFCQYVASSGRPLMVSDSRKDPVLADNGAVDDLNVIAYLGVPVRDPMGTVLGSFCVIDSEPRDWTADDLDALKDLVAMLEAELALRHTVSERDVVMQEMNHRVRNLFSLINGMVRLDRRTAKTVDELADGIATRLSALNTAHSMIVPVVQAQGRVTGEGTHLQPLVEKLLAPYSGGAILEIAGPSVDIGAKAAIYLTLTLHELATNAAKYGALSVEGGTLSVTWEIADEKLNLNWVETGQSWGDFTETKGTGFGSKLLTIAVEGQLRGAIITDVTPMQFSHRLSLPLEHLAL